jgi:hypothetical protein
VLFQRLSDHHTVFEGYKRTRYARALAASVVDHVDQVLVLRVVIEDQGSYGASIFRSNYFL